MTGVGMLSLCGSLVAIIWILWACLVQDPAYWAMWVSIFSLCCVAVAPMAIELYRKQFDWLDLKNVFVLFFVLQFGMWPVLVYMLGYTSTFGLPITFLDSRYNEFLRGEVYAIVGLGCFFLGRYIPLGKPQRCGVQRVQNGITTADGFPILFLSTLMVGAGILGFLGLTAAGGGFFEFVSHIDEFRTTSLLGVGYLIFLIVVAQLGALALILFYFAFGRYKVLSHIALLGVLALSVLGGVRHVALSAIGGYLVARHFLYKPIRINVSLLFVGVIFFALNIFYPLYRGLGPEVFEYASHIENLTDVDWMVVAYALLGRFHGAETIARVIDITGADGFQHGRLFFAELFTGVIPRILWPAKPESSGMVANTTFFYEIFSGGETGSAVITLLGELYWIWGLPAIVLGMFCLGVIFRGLYEGVQGQNRDIEKVGLYSIGLTFGLFVNESLSLHLFHFLFKVVVWVGLFGTVKIFSRPVVQQPELKSSHSRVM